MSKQHIQRILNELSSTWGLDALALDLQNRCRITTDDGLEVEISLLEPDDILVLEASLVSTNVRIPANWLETLLQANFGWKQARGSTLGLDRERGRIVLQKSVDAKSLTIDEATVLFDHFFHWASHWKNKLNDSTLSETSEQISDPALFV